NNDEIKNLYITELNHIKGVNAIIEGEKIKFSNSGNIIYGLNGSGKSGYFRILHGLVGGEKQNEILSNINSTNEDFEIEIKYGIDGIEKNYLWKDNKSFGISPFNKIKVFDSDYTNFYIDKRDNKTNLSPLGINLFEIIIKGFDDLKSKLDEYKKNIKIPDIDILKGNINNTNIKSIFEKNDLLEADKIKLEKYFIFSNEDTIELEGLEKQKKDLENNNQDTIKIINQKITLLKNIINNLNQIRTDIENFYTNIKTNIDLYKSSLIDANNKKEQIEILKDISKTTEWEDFIKKGNTYFEKLDNNFNKNKCIYCHQELGEQAKNLIKAYGIFVNDESQNKLNIALNNVLSLKENNKIDILIPELSIFDENIDFKNEILKVFNYYKDIKTKLELFIDNKLYEVIILNDYKNFFEKLNSSILVEEKKIELLNSNLEERNKEISSLNIKINELKDKKIISENKTKIEELFKIKKEIYDLNKISINTTTISILQKKVIQELVSEEFKRTFKEELNNLNKNIEIDILDNEVSKGNQKIQKKVNGYDIRKVCSEGEQKTIAISHFLTESILDKNNFPIILDDPVNSLDHEISDKLAKRLLEISSQRQVIIFTHNKLFLDSLYYWSSNLKEFQIHKCKNNNIGGCNSEGKHIYFYNTRKQDKNNVGKISFKEQESYNFYIKEAQNELKDYNDAKIVCISSYLKSAIEHFIDKEILNGCEPTKNHKTKGSIQWSDLKKLNPDNDLIDNLKKYWDDLSNRGTHSTGNSNENPITEPEIKEIINYISNYKKGIV
nr:AAA family ATPase [Candidatus Gracilibacteria bacterium]